MYSCLKYCIVSNPKNRKSTPKQSSLNNETLKQSCVLRFFSTFMCSQSRNQREKQIENGESAIEQEAQNTCLPTPQPLHTRLSLPAYQSKTNAKLIEMQSVWKEMGKLRKQHNDNAINLCSYCCNLCNN